MCYSFFISIGEKGMEIFNLFVIFIVIIGLLGFRQPLYRAILGGLGTLIVLFRISIFQWGSIIVNFLTNSDSLTVLLSLYLITFLQKMLESRKQIKLAEEDLNNLFNNRRINVSGASLFIGLLPSAAAMVLCAEIVKDMTDGYLTKKEQAFITTWFRHIPESTLPTYAGVLLMANLSGVPLPTFMLFMVVPMIVLYLIAYIPYLRKVPKRNTASKTTNKKIDTLNLFKHLWSLLLILILILFGKMTVSLSVIIVIALAAIVYRFKKEELVSMVKSAFEIKLLGNIALVLLFKEFLDFTQVLTTLPTILSGLPIPTFLVFSLLFFVGCLISGSNGIIALGTPLAFAAMPNGGVALMVLLMCITHAANQLSPTHICLLVNAEYFNISMGDLIRKTIPASLLFIGIILVYYLCLSLIL